MDRYDIEKMLSPLLVELRAIRKELEKLNARPVPAPAPVPWPLPFPDVPAPVYVPTPLPLTGWLCGSCGVWVPAGNVHLCVR